MSSPPSRMCSNFKKTPKLGRTPTNPFALPASLHVSLPTNHRNRYLSSVEASLVGGLTMNIQFVPILSKYSKTHSGTIVFLCHLHSVPCHVLSSMTHATSLEEQNRVVHVIDKFTLYPFPPSLQLAFKLITQNPAVKPPHHHPCGNTVTVHFSPLQQQS